jgi:hypothetical protein
LLHPSPETEFWLLIDGSGAKFESSGVGLLAVLDLTEVNGRWVVAGVLPEGADSAQVTASTVTVPVSAEGVMRAWCAIVPDQTLTVRFLDVNGNTVLERVGHAREIGDLPASGAPMTGLA